MHRELQRRGRLDPRPDPAAGRQRIGTGRVRGAIGHISAESLALRRAVGSGTVVGRAVGIERPGVACAIGVGSEPVLIGLRPTSIDRDVMEDELVATGRFVRIEMRGERSGLARSVTVGFAEDVDGEPGSILVAAGSGDAAWARNLLADPACHVTLGERSFEAIAEPLEPADHARAIRELILRYGTPAEGLGHGPSFRLRPVEASAP